MTGWTVIVPVKPWRLAKSRLLLDASARERLARAFALDVIEALQASSAVDTVVVVTAEEDLRRASRRSGFELLTDRPLRSADPLNDAVAAARHWASRRRPGAPLAALVADLPCLTGAAVTATLDSALRHPSAFVPDPDGTGTTMVAATRASSLTTAFGPGSAGHHARLGHTCLWDADVRVRRDVDETADLEAAALLGLSPRTEDVVTDLLAGRVRAQRSLA